MEIDKETEIKLVTNELENYFPLVLTSIIIDYTYAEIILVNNIEESVLYDLLESYLNHRPLTDGPYRFFCYIYHNVYYILYIMPHVNKHYLLETKNFKNIDIISSSPYNTLLSNLYFIIGMVYYDEYILIVSCYKICVISLISKLKKEVNIVPNISWDKSLFGCHVVNDKLIILYNNNTQVLINIKSILSDDNVISISIPFNNIINGCKFAINSKNQISLFDNALFDYYYFLNIDPYYVLANYHHNNFKIYYDRRKIKNRTLEYTDCFL